MTTKKKTKSEDITIKLAEGTPMFRTTDGKIYLFAGRLNETTFKFSELCEESVSQVVNAEKLGKVILEGDIPDKTVQKTADGKTIPKEITVILADNIPFWGSTSGKIKISRLGSVTKPVTIPTDHPDIRQVVMAIKLGVLVKADSKNKKEVQQNETKNLQKITPEKISKAKLMSGRTFSELMDFIVNCDDIAILEEIKSIENQRKGNKKKPRTKVLSAIDSKLKELKELAKSEEIDVGNKIPKKIDVVEMEYTEDDEDPEYFTESKISANSIIESMKGKK